MINISELIPVVIEHVGPGGYCEVIYANKDTSEWDQVGAAHWHVERNTGDRLIHAEDKDGYKLTVHVRIHTASGHIEEYHIN